MDATTAAASSSMAKTVNILATSITRRITNPTTSTQSCPCTKPKVHTLYASTRPFYTTFLTHQRTPNSNPRDSVLTFTHCSTKPNIDSDNATDGNSTVEPNSDSKTQNQSVTPASNTTLSSSSSSSSSSSTSSSCLSPSSFRGLVFDLGPLNSWDGAEIGSPVVKRFLSDEEERWYMWYHGSSNENSGSDTMGLAVSSNGVHWERGNGPVRSSGDVGLVMNCSIDWWAFDTQSIRPSEVVVMSSSKVRGSSAVYWLYYSGFSPENVEFADGVPEFDLENPERASIHNENDRIGKVLKSLPGLAISQDGRHWARIEGEHHTGALLDVGSQKEWDSTFIASPQVVYHKSGDLRMYYHSFDVEKGQFGIGIARSRDGMKWLKLGKILGGGGIGCFDEFGAMNACVVRNRKDGNYVMAYEGVGGDGKRSIGLAVSTDGLKDWRKFCDEAILKPSSMDGEWDNVGVGSPCLVQMDGDDDEWRLYYRGVGNGGGRSGIGMAVSQGSDITSLRKWTGFHL